MRSLQIFFLVCVLVAGATAADAPLLHPLFSDGAVLQRDQPITVWGWAKPGDKVVVTLSGTQPAAAPVTVETPASGKWSAVLGPVASGTACTLSVQAGGREAGAKNLLIGDVWLCGGQSNMEFPVDKGMNVEAEHKAADLPEIRHFTVGRKLSPTPETTVSGSWVTCSPQTVGRFTAVGFYFARALHQELKVPIGIVHSSWGGTDAESWVSEGTLASLPDHASVLAEWRTLVAGVTAQSEKTGKDYGQLLQEWFKVNDPGTAATPAWSAGDVSDSAWKTVKLPGMFEALGVIAADWDGTLWLRRSFTVPDSAAGKTAKLNLGRINGMDTTWIDGVQVGEAEGWVQRSYPIAAERLKPGTHTLAIRLLNRNGSIGLSEHLSLVFADNTNVSLEGPWHCQVGASLAKAPLPLRFGYRNPTVLFNGMIAPLAPLRLRGVAWYQGEYNVERAFRYRTLLPALIREWRGLFQDEQLPFLVVSLANYKERKAEPSEHPWAELREAQALTVRATPNTGLAVTIDIGEAGDIHPKNKQEVGRRLALAAEAIAYGKPVEWSGPWYRSMAVEGAQIRLQFDHLGGGLAVHGAGALTGFAIAGADHTFVWADARIDGASVIVSSPKVTAPVAVRYAWAANPACNLSNAADLPAVPFRTDDWPGVTWPK